MTAAVHRRGGSPIAIERVGNALIVGRNTDASRSAALAHALPHEAGRTTVVVVEPIGLTIDEVVDQLATRLPHWLPEDRWPVRLVLAGSGAPGRSGEAAAQRLATWLGAEVVAPDGPVLAVPDGSLFVAGRGRAWRTFQPGGTTGSEGPRHPVPRWRDAPPDTIEVTIPGLVVDQVPTGLWLRAAGHRRPDDLAYAVPAGAAGPALLLSAPGDRPLPVGAVRDVVAALPSTLREELVFTAYGPVETDGRPLGLALALGLEMPVRCRLGLSIRTPSRSWDVTAIDAAGRPSWRPFGYELEHQPDAETPPQVLGWTKPTARLGITGPGLVTLTDDWAVEIVQSGLWVRPDWDVSGGKLVRELPLDPQWCTVVVGAAGNDPADIPWPAVGRLLRELPTDARERLRVATFTDLGDRTAHRAERRLKARLAGRPVYRLCQDGTLMAGHEIVYAPVPEPAAGPVHEPYWNERLTRDARPETVACPPPPAVAVAGGPAPRSMPRAEPPEPVRPAASIGRSRAAVAPGDLLRPSTERERALVHTSLGRLYDSYARVVTRLLSRRPGLRGGAIGDALITDLVAAYACLGGDHRPISDALRTGRPVPDPAVVVCAASGLRRFASCQAPVFCGVPAGVDVTGVYGPGQVVREAGFITATLDHRITFGTAAEVVIWSTSARRLDGIVTPERAHEVVFPPGAEFSVLAVERTRVFLRERSAGYGNNTLDAQILARLREAAEQRAGTPAEQRVAVPDPARFSVPPGLDVYGRAIGDPVPRPVEWISSSLTSGH